MKQFIEAYPENPYSVAYAGYKILININQIMIIYKSNTNRGYQYNIIVNLGSTTETWLIDEETYKNLIKKEIN